LLVGVGIDLTPVDRIARLLGRYAGRFEEKVFTPGERAYCRGRAAAAEHFAARFAAKEAALKALGVPSGLSWHELEVVSGPGGKPELALHGAAARAMAALGVVRLHLSLTHAGGQAAAVVIAEGEGPGRSGQEGARGPGASTDGGSAA
jgi:holo-[acyl-carrier protein] synthase